MTIGRDSSCDIILPDMSVSKKHAQIFIEEGRTVIADGVDGKPSSNGVYVNDARITGRVALKKGDVVKMGVFKFDVRNAPAAKRSIKLDDITSAHSLKLFLEYGDMRKVEDERLLHHIRGLKMETMDLVKIFDDALDLAMAQRQLQRVGLISRIKQDALQTGGGTRGASAKNREASKPPKPFTDTDETLIDPQLVRTYYGMSEEKRRRRILTGVLIAAAALLIAVAVIFIIF